MDLIKSDILNLSSKDKIGIIHCCTPIADDDVTYRIKRDPNWRTLVYPYIMQYPDDYAKGDKSLWSEYYRIYDDETVSRRSHTGSLEYYKTHRDDMDRGAVIFADRYSVKDG